MAKPTYTKKDELAPLPNPLPELMTASQAARYLQLSIPQLAAWRKNGNGPAFVQLGPSRVCYRLEDLRSFVLSRVVSGEQKTKPVFQ